MALDSGGNIYVADYGNNRIRKIANDANKTVSTIAGNGTAGFADGAGTSAQFSSPRGVAVDSVGNLYVADSANNRIRKIANDANRTVTTLAGAAAATWADGSGTTARFNLPIGISIDASGNLYIADKSNYRVRKISCP